MKQVRPAAAHLKDLEPYDPRYLPARIYLNANENPYGMPRGARQALVDTLESMPLHRYPDPLCKQVRDQIAARLEVPSDCILVGNGGDELLFDLCLAYGGEGRKLLVAPPTFSVYNTDAALTHTEVVELFRTDSVSPERLLDMRLNEQAVLERVSSGDIDLVMLASPNNPTGDCLSLSFIEELLQASDALVVIDHAYIEFAHAAYDATSLLAQHANLAILRTFSKAYGLAGVRIGYLAGSQEVIRELKKVRQPYSVDTLAARAALAALQEEEEVQARVTLIVSERERLFRELGVQGLGFPVAPSEANYVLFRVPAAHEVWQRLYDEYGILVRDLSLAPGLTDCLRVTVGTPEENTEFLHALCTITQQAEGSIGSVHNADPGN